MLFKLLLKLHAFQTLPQAPCFIIPLSQASCFSGSSSSFMLFKLSSSSILLKLLPQASYLSKLHALQTFKLLQSSPMLFIFHAPSNLHAFLKPPYIFKPSCLIKPSPPPTLPYQALFFPPSRRAFRLFTSSPPCRACRHFFNPTPCQILLTENPVHFYPPLMQSTQTVFIFLKVI